MRSFETKLAFHLVNKRQASNRDRFGPAIITNRQAVPEPLLDPLVVSTLKISKIRKSAQLTMKRKSSLSPFLVPVRQRRTASLRPGAGWLIVCGETEFSSYRQRGHRELRRNGDVISRGPRCNPWPDCGPRRAGESRGCRPISCKSKTGLWRAGVCRRSRRGARLRCA